MVQPGRPSWARRPGPCTSVGAGVSLPPSGQHHPPESLSKLRLRLSALSKDGDALPVCRLSPSLPRISCVEEKDPRGHSQAQSSPELSAA